MNTLPAAVSWKDISFPSPPTHFACNYSHSCTNGGSLFPLLVCIPQQMVTTYICLSYPTGYVFLCRGLHYFSYHTLYIALALPQPSPLQPGPAPVYETLASDCQTLSVETHRPIVPQRPLAWRKLITWLPNLRSSLADRRIVSIRPLGGLWPPWGSNSSVSLSSVCCWAAVRR